MKVPPPQPNLGGSESGEKLPDYLQRGKLHVRVLNGANGKFIEAQLQLRTEGNSVLVIADTGLGGKLKPMNFAPFQDGTLDDQGGTSGSGNQISYQSFSSDAMKDLLKSADEEALREIQSQIDPSTYLDTEGQGESRDLIYPRDRQELWAMIDTELVKRQERKVE